MPILTRYKKEAGIKAFVKKELFDARVPDETKPNEITVLTTPTLCVQLNTLYVSTSKLELYLGSFHTCFCGCEDISFFLSFQATFLMNLCFLSLYYLDWHISFWVEGFVFLVIFLLAFVLY